MIPQSIIDTLAVLALTAALWVVSVGIEVWLGRRR